MITQEEIEEFLHLTKEFGSSEWDSALDVLRIAHEHTREELDRYIELHDKFESAAKKYVHSYMIANHKVRGIEHFDTGYYKTSWDEWQRYQFTGIRRRAINEHEYDTDKKYPEGYITGHFTARYRDEDDERRSFYFSVNELLIDNPLQYLTDKYTLIMEEQKRNQEAARIADQERIEKLRYEKYLELKAEFESITS